MRDKNITVGELKRKLEAYDDNTEIDFFPLQFGRLHKRDTNVINLEFVENLKMDADGNISGCDPR